jgi:hypothetical protein
MKTPIAACRKQLFLRVYIRSCYIAIATMPPVILLTCDHTSRREDRDMVAMKTSIRGLLLFMGTGEEKQSRQPSVYTP